MSDSLRPHGLQPTRLLRPWDFPGKRTGVGCRCLLRQYPQQHHLKSSTWEQRRRPSADRQRKARHTGTTDKGAGPQRLQGSGWTQRHPHRQTSKRGKQTSYINTSMWNLEKNGTAEPIYKAEIEIQSYEHQEGRGLNPETGIDICTPLHIER